MLLVVVHEAFAQSEEIGDGGAIVVEQDMTTADRRKLQEKAATAGVLLFALVVISLAALLGFALVWGARARRTAREPLPPAPRGDELWFLKSKSSDKSPGPKSHSGEPGPSGETRA